MNFKPILVGAALVLASGAANAAVLYDSVDVGAGQLNAGADPLDPAVSGPIASSFTTTSATTLNSVQLMLGTSSTSDGGSIVVVLTPNNGGQPFYTSIVDPNASSGSLTTFSNATTLGSIADSSFTAANTAQLITLNTSVPLAANTTYWVGAYTPQDPASVTAGDSAVNGTYGDGEWYNTAANPTGGVGIGSADLFNTYQGIGTFPATEGAYELVVSAPEPASLALMGVGLTVTGFLRRRRANRA